MKYLAFVLSTGEIQSLRRAKSSFNLPEGYSADHDATVVYVTNTPSGPKDFMDNNVYNFTTKSWNSRTPPPNNIAQWDGTDWIWDKEDLFDLVRLQRNKYLLDSDWSALRGAPLTQEQKQEADTYRQSLRDIRDSIDLDNLQSPEDVVWPTKPSFL